MNYEVIFMNKNGETYILPDNNALLFSNETGITQSMFDGVPEICKGYGLYGCVVGYKLGSNLLSSGYYAVVCPTNTFPAPEELYALAKERENNPTKEYFDMYVEKVDEKNSMTTILNVINYCKNYEFIKSVYEDFKTPMPHKLRRTDLQSLLTTAHNYYDDEMPSEIRENYKANLKHFFRSERRNRKGLHRKWNEFYTSDRFDVNASRLKNLFYFLKRKNQIIGIKQLTNTSGDLGVLKFNGWEFEQFQKIMKEQYPTIPYSIIGEFKVDNGELELTEEEQDDPTLNPFGRVVTQQEFDKSLFNDLVNDGEFRKMRVAKDTFYTIKFRESDGQIFRGIEQKLALHYAEPTSVSTLYKRGKVIYTYIPRGEFLNFAANAKRIGMLYAIDNGQRFELDGSSVPVLYNAIDYEDMQELKLGIVEDLAIGSHTLAAIKRKEKLGFQIQKAEEKQIKSDDIQFMAPQLRGNEI